MTPLAHSPLSEALLSRLPERGRLGAAFYSFAEIDSTNAWLLARAAELPDGAIATAEFQTAGRGRLGRRWLAPRGASILLSFLIREPADSPLITHAGLLAALAACEAIEATTDCRPGVRWPNDLALGGRKLGGVLAETVALSDGRALVVGVGINCLQQQGHFSPELRERATSLEMTSRGAIDRAAVAAALIQRLDVRFAVAARDDAVQAVRRDVPARSVDIGASATLTQDGRRHHGTILEISESGDLLVQLETGERRYFAAATTTREW